MEFSVQILGCNSALPAQGRHPTSQLLKLQHQNYLIDCGEGTQMRLNQYHIKKSKIQSIFISHLHGDHIFGLLPLITSYILQGREQPLQIIGPKQIKVYLESSFNLLNIEVPFPIAYTLLEDIEDFQSTIYSDKLLEVDALKLHHRAPTFGYIFREKDRGRKIKADQIQKYDIAVEQLNEVKAGADAIDRSGKRIPNSWITEAGPKPRKYCFITDTRIRPELATYIENVDLLYHESTFLDELKERAEITHHSTAKEAAQLAAQAKVTRLLLGHFSSRYADLKPLLDEAQQYFENSSIATEGEIFSI